MSDVFGEIISDLEGAWGEGDVDRSVLSGVVRAGLEEGLSGNAIQRGLSDAGLGVRRGVLQDLVRTIRAELAIGAAPPPVSLTELPDRNNIARVAEGREGTFRSQILITYRNAIGDGEYAIERTVFSVSSDTLMTPQDALGIAQEIWQTNSAMYGDRQLYGLEYTGTLQNMGAGWGQSPIG